MRLEGEDAKEFEKYMKDPTFTEEGLQLIQEAARIVEREKARVSNFDPPV